MPERAEKDDYDEPFGFAMDDAPPDFEELADDPIAAKKIGKIISEAMINGPWTGC